MKEAVLATLAELKAKLKALRAAIRKLSTVRVARVAERNEADNIATLWVEKLRSPLEHKFKLPRDVIDVYSAAMSRLHALSRPNNLASSYIQVLDSLLKDFDDKFVLPIKQTSSTVDHILDLTKLIPALPDPHESRYLREAVECAAAGHFRAAIVMGWCCIIDRLQRTIEKEGFAKFNAASLVLKNQTSGKFKHWNKGVTASNLSELQTIFDTDLVIVLEGMGLIDGNQAQRMGTCFQYRCHSAHPGQAPILEHNVLAFFSDITDIILQNPHFKVS